MLILCSGAFVSCKKDADEKAYAIEGTWEGTIRATGSTLPAFYGIKIKANHILERYNSNGVVTATGTWQLNSNSFTGFYKYAEGGTVLNVTATLDKNTNKLSGSYQNDGNGTGTWSATKK